MKKLMTMIAAVAMAFGLYAADSLNNSVDFTSYSDVNPWLLTGSDGQTVDPLWSYTNGDPAENEAKIESGTLVLKTGSKVLSRAFAATAPEIGEGLYADMKLDLCGQALDEVPDVTGAKLALFALDGTEIEGLPNGTNVYVYAAYGNDGKALFQLKDNGETFVGSPRRIAVKTYANVLSNGSRPGFLVFISSDDAAISETDIAKVDAFFTFNGTKWVAGSGDYLGGLSIAGACSKWTQGTQKSLFVSMDADPNTAGTLASVEFKGNAAISSITLTDDDPGFPADGFTMNIADGSLAFDVVSGATKSGNTLFAAVEGGKVVINNIGATKELIEVTIDGQLINESTEVPGQYEFDWATDSTLSISEYDVAATVDGKAFKSLFGDDGAIAYVNKNGGTLKLAQDVSVGEAEEEALNFAGGDVVLDLNGQTITITGEGKALANVGVLTIMDSKTAGNIVGDVQNYNALVVSNGVFNGALQNAYDVGLNGVTTIYDGTFNGAVENIAEDAEDESLVKIIAQGGEFLQKDNEKNTLIEYIDEDNYEIAGEEGDDYWTVQEIQKPTTFKVYAAPAVEHSKLTVRVNGEDLPGEENVYTANIGDTIVVAYTADEGYQFADGVKTTDSFTTDDSETFQDAPEPTIKTFTVTYIVDGTEDSSEQVNWGGKPAKVPSPAARTGYTGAWNVQNPAEVEIKENTTFTYTYTAETYTITYMYGEQTLTLAPSNYTYGVGATLPDKATATSVIGTELDGWYDNKDLTGTAVTAIGTDETGVKTFWAKIVSVTPAGEVEKKVDGEVNDAGKAVINAIVAATGSDQTKVDAYVAKVYVEKIPAADVNAADPALVPASMYYGLPLMAAEPTVTVVAATAETGAAAFTFTVNVNGKPADLVKAEAQKMVKYTTKLGDDKTPFHESIPDEVTITPATDGTMKAEFTAGEATAGFMKVDVSMPAE